MDHFLVIRWLFLLVVVLLPPSGFIVSNFQMKTTKLNHWIKSEQMQHSYTVLLAKLLYCMCWGGKKDKNFRSAYSSFSSTWYNWVLGDNLFKYLWNPALLFTLGKSKQSAVATVGIDTQAIAPCNTAAVVICTRNFGLGCDSPRSSLSRCGSGVHCLLQILTASKPHC